MDHLHGRQRPYMRFVVWVEVSRLKILPVFHLMPLAKRSVTFESHTSGPSCLDCASALIVPSPGIFVPSFLGTQFGPLGMVPLAVARLQRIPGPYLAWELHIQEVTRLPLPP